MRGLLRWTLKLASPTRLNNGAPSAYARGIEHGTWAGMACIGLALLVLTLAGWHRGRA